MDIKLLVLRTDDTKRLAEFYTLLGLNFEYHKHGNSPYHYSATVGKTVLEIYPLSKDQVVADKHLRIGFNIDDFDTIMKRLKEMKTVFLAEPAETDFGFRAIVVDPDGRKIELYNN